MDEGITGWRLHVGVIFPTPVPPRAVLEFYEAVPEGVDMTTVLPTIQQLADDDMDEAIKGMERAAKQLASFDVDLIYQSGVPPVVRRGLGFGDELADRLSQAAGLPAITDMSSVIDAMRTAKLKTLAMATPFEQFINDRLIQYLAAEKIEIKNNTALGIKRTVEIRRLPIPVEYAVARKTYLESATKPDGIYIPCGGWGSIQYRPLGKLPRLQRFQWVRGCRRTANALKRHQSMPSFSVTSNFAARDNLARPLGCPGQRTGGRGCASSQR